MRSAFILAPAAVLLCAAGAVRAVGPRLIPFQGRLTNAAGQPLPDGTRNVTFRLYTTAVGGAAVWTESQTVNTVGGHFSATLGAFTPFPPALLFDVPYYAGISVAGDPEMTPRLPLQAVPYALSLSLPSRADTSTDAAALAIMNAGEGAAISGVRTATTGTDAAIVGQSASTTSSAVGVLGEITSTAPGGFSAAVRGINRGTSGSGIGVYGSQDGSGWGVYGSSISGFGVYGSTPNGTGVYAASGSGTGFIATSNSGVAASVNATGPASTATALEVTQNGLGRGVRVHLANDGSGARGLDVTVDGVGSAVIATSAGGNGVWGIASKTSAAGLLGDNANGEAVVGRSAGGVGVGAVVGRNDDRGSGVRGFNVFNGPGGRFETFSSTNTGNGVEVDVAGSGNGLYVNYRGGGTSTTATRNLAIFANNGSRKARIDNTGKGFFNGGTQSSGADVAEAFAVHGDRDDYEPGDVLVISAHADRTLEKSSEPYATAVAGVYSTRPGTLLTEREADSDHSDLVPLGVIGVIPTKVTAENGPIARGDLLVTSSTPGHAMKAGPNPPPGTVIGKALAPFNGETFGLIRVLVNVR